MATGEVGALPTFLIIGAMKCGTSSVHHYLDCHPDISMSHPKEVDFFLSEEDVDPARVKASGASFNWSRGVDWYASHFDASRVARGEASPNYTSPEYHGVASRIHGLLPEVKLVYMVRDPYERAMSHYYHRVREGLEHRPPELALSDPNSGYLARSMYYHCLAPFLEFIPDDGLLIVDQERLRSDRYVVLREIYGFLGVRDHGWTSEFNLELNTAASKGKVYTVASHLRRTRIGGRVWKSVPDRAINAVGVMLERHRTGGAGRGAPAVSSDDGVIRARFASLVAADGEEFQKLRARVRGRGKASPPSA